jgi:SNF2 family DNA or RNA helicase
MVYRLITARTYEATMFERASLKLGLEQALFSKENRGEVEELLKHGAYNLIDEDAHPRVLFAREKLLCV